LSGTLNDVVACFINMKQCASVHSLRATGLFASSHEFYY